MTWVLTFFVAVGLALGMHSGGSGAGSSRQAGPSGAANLHEQVWYLLLPQNEDFVGPFDEEHPPNPAHWTVHDNHGNIVPHPQLRTLRLPMGQRPHYLPGTTENLDLHAVIMDGRRRAAAQTHRYTSFIVPGLGHVGHFHLEINLVRDLVRIALLIDFGTLMRTYFESEVARNRLLLSLHVQWALFYENDAREPIRIVGNDVWPNGLWHPIYRVPIPFPLWPENNIDPQGEVIWQSVMGDYRGNLEVSRGNYYQWSALLAPKPAPQGPPGATMAPAAQIIYTMTTTDRAASSEEVTLHQFRGSNPLQGRAQAHRRRPRGGHVD